MKHKYKQWDVDRANGFEKAKEHTSQKNVLLGGYILRLYTTTNLEKLNGLQAAMFPKITHIVSLNFMPS